MEGGKILFVCRDAACSGAEMAQWLRDAGWDTAVIHSSEPSSRKIFSSQNPDIIIIDSHVLGTEDFLSADPRSSVLALLDRSGGDESLLQTGDLKIQGVLDTGWPRSWTLQALESAAEAQRSRAASLEESTGLKSLLSRCPGLIYRCAGYPDGLPVYVGGAASGITGFTPEEFLKGAVSLGSLILEDDRRMAANTLYLRISRKLPFELEFRIRNREGRVRWIRDTGAGVFSYDGVLKHTEGFWTDITEARMKD